MLGSVVPRRCALSCTWGCTASLLPHCHRLAPRREAEARETQHEAWEIVQRGHAVANGVYVAAVNRVGTEDGLQFWGASFLSDPFGRLLARASQETEETLVVSCDLERIDTIRQHWPFLRDRRIDAYGSLTKRYLD